MDTGVREVWPSPCPLLAHAQIDRVIDVLKDIPQAQGACEKLMQTIYIFGDNVRPWGEGVGAGMQPREWQGGWPAVTSGACALARG